jgi:Poly(3-hydroxyalkanoate) synthetase
VGLYVAAYRPYSKLSKLRCPVLVLVAEGDCTTPPAPAVRAAQRSPNAELTRYPIGHFAIYVEPHFERTVADQAGSLGANATLEAAVQAPERLRGLLVEMPVLDNALLGCALAFTPLLVGLTFGEPLARMASLGARLVPRGLSRLADIPLDALGQDPGPSAAVLQGLFFGRIAPPRSERREIDAPALVIGHSRDPIHPFSDSGMLVSELANGRLLRASSLLELRLAPARLMAEIGGSSTSASSSERAGQRRTTGATGAGARSAPAGGGRR